MKIGFYENGMCPLPKMRFVKRNVHGSYLRILQQVWVPVGVMPSDEIPGAEWRDVPLDEEASDP